MAPEYFDARLALARLLDLRGERDEARAAARRALGEAERATSTETVAEARRLLARLSD